MLMIMMFWLIDRVVMQCTCRLLGGPAESAAPTSHYPIWSLVFIIATITDTALVWTQPGGREVADTVIDSLGSGEFVEAPINPQLPDKPLPAAAHIYGSI